MVLAAFYNFVARHFSEYRCREDKIDPIEFNPGVAINLGYNWISLFKKLTVPPYAALPPPPCKAPCKRKCCRYHKNPKTCSPFCERKHKKRLSNQHQGCGHPCCNLAASRKTSSVEI